MTESESAAMSKLPETAPSASSVNVVAVPTLVQVPETSFCTWTEPSYGALPPETCVLQPKVLSQSG